MVGITTLGPVNSTLSRVTSLPCLSNARSDNAYAVGKRLSDLALDKQAVHVTAVRRGGIRGPEPSGDTRFMAGDILVLYGSPEGLDEAEKRLLQG